MADEKKTQDEKMLDLAGKMAEKIVEGLIPQLVATASILQKPAPGQAPQHSPATGNKPRCQVCGQHLSSCNNEHVEMIVLPVRRPEFAQWYQGYFINGVRYLSEHAGHKVSVPKSCANDISNGVRLWEDTEAHMRQGKVADHHSGSVDRPNLAAKDGVRFQ